MRQLSQFLRKSPDSLYNGLLIFTPVPQQALPPKVVTLSCKLERGWYKKTAVESKTDYYKVNNRGKLVAKESWLYYSYSLHDISNYFVSIYPTADSGIKVKL